jgi:hypothetical protein
MMLDQNWTPSHAAPARDVRKNRFGKSLIYFPSQKNHAQLICESHNEAVMCLLLEYQIQVTQYYIQPVSHCYDTRKKSCQYTPDFFVQRDDDHHYFIELKEKLADPKSHYQSVLDNFAAAAAAMGYGFEVFALSEFPKDETLDNLGLLYSRSYQVTAYEQRQLMECLQAWTGPLTIALLLACDPAPSLRAVCAAAFQQKINFDLSQMLTLNTPLINSVKNKSKSANEKVHHSLTPHCLTTVHTHRCSIVAETY